MPKACWDHLELLMSIQMYRAAEPLPPFRSGTPQQPLEQVFEHVARQRSGWHDGMQPGWRALALTYRFSLQAEGPSSGTIRPSGMDVGLHRCDENEWGEKVENDAPVPRI